MIDKIIFFSLKFFDGIFTITNARKNPYFNLVEVLDLEKSFILLEIKRVGKEEEIKRIHLPIGKKEMVYGLFILMITKV